MSDSDLVERPTEIREVVGLFQTRDAFDRAVELLLDAGVAREALSILASRKPLGALPPKGPAARPRDDAMTALVGELTYLFPLTTAGLLAFVGGPITAELAAVVAAGVGGLAIKDYLNEFTSHPRTDAFAKALETGGIILWVNARDGEDERKLSHLLEMAGADNVHISIRPGPEL